MYIFGGLRTSKRESWENMQKITTFLWFNDQAEEAMKFYVSVFKNAKILSVDRMPEGTPGPQGKVLSGSFQIEGQEFMVLNGARSSRSPRRSLSSSTVRRR